MLVVVAVLARVWLSHGIATPWILVDELIYADLAKSASAGHLLQIRGEHSGLYNILYPLLIAPAWRAGSMATTYSLAKVINVVVMTIAAPVFYFWARRLVAPLLAVIGVVLVLAMPAFIYTGELMTENAFFPAFLLACFTIAVALERPTLLHQLTALAAVGLTVAVRTQGLVVAALLVAATLVKLLLDARVEGRRALLTGLRAYAPMVLALAGLAILYVAYKAARGATLSSGLGAYGGLSSVHYSFGAVRHWTLLHFAELGLSVAVIPHERVDPPDGSGGLARNAKRRRARVRRRGGDGSGHRRRPGRRLRLAVLAANRRAEHVPRRAAAVARAARLDRARSPAAAVF